MKKKIFIISCIFLFCLNNNLCAKQNEKSFIQNAFITYENDSVYRRDEYYTNGIHLFFLSKNYETDKENKFLSKILNIKNKSFHNYSFGIGQKIYTPYDIEIKELIKDDRPYAGYLYTYLNKNIKHDNITDVVGISIGLTGPSSLAETAQTHVHEWIGSPIPEGWDNQLSNEFLAMANWLRVIDLHKVKQNEFDWKLLPKFSVNLGTPFTGGNIGLEYRYGWNLLDDLFQNEMNSTPLGIVNYNNSLSYYFFIEAQGNLILYNTFLDGNISGYTPNIEKNNFYYKLMSGITLTFHNLYAKYSTIFISKEFKEQEREQFVFSFTIGYLF